MDNLKKWQKYLLLALSFVLVFVLGVFSGRSYPNSAGTEAVQSAAEIEADSSETISESKASETNSGNAAEPAALTDDVMILFTSDVHCGITKGFGYSGLQKIRKTLERSGYHTILLDNGDAIQGEAIGKLTRGLGIIKIMNELKYDVAVPGNHEFDYGVERFLELTELADFPYISCNFCKENELVFSPYVIKEAGGIKIAFVGITTPTTLTSSTPEFFEDENGKFIYGFMNDQTGQMVYDAVQKAVDSARAEGADYVYLAGHTGEKDICIPWTSKDIIEHTNGVDVFIDGHSHDINEYKVMNKDGEEVVRIGCGTKLERIGYSHISKEKGIVKSSSWDWNNDVSVPELLGITSEVDEMIGSTMAELNAIMQKKVAETSFDLTIYKPLEAGEDRPERAIRKMETNLGDLCADAVKQQTGAEIAFINGGGIRSSIAAGDITYGDIISVFPFGNQICLVELSGQSILDALEFSVHSLPEEFGGFLQVSGLTYEVDTSIPTPVIVDDNRMCIGIKGERRIKNVKIGEEPLDPNKTYTVGGQSYILINAGDGYTSFKDSNVVNGEVKLDDELLIDYILDDLGGSIPDIYSDPYGQGRIKILN